MVERRHLEDALAAKLVAAYLEDDRERLQYVDSADEDEQDFLFDEDRDDAERPTQGERAHVPHEDFGGVGVVPEEAQGTAGHGGAEDSELRGTGETGKPEVDGELAMAADVGEHGHCAAGDDHQANCESI